MVVHVLKVMVQQLAVFVLKALLAQDAMSIFRFVKLTHVLMVAHALKDLEP